MNFLAHCAIPDQALEVTHPDLIAGGFLGDFVKGPVPASLPEPLATGVRLHRRIDAYSNHQPGIRASCGRFPEHLRRFAPIFVDVAADHLLARHWRRFHPRPLPQFTADTYQAVAHHAARLTPEGRRFFDYARGADLLARYRGTDAMNRGLRSVSRRLRREAMGDEVLEVVARLMPELEEDFLGYYPDLVAHAAEWLAQQPD